MRLTPKKYCAYVIKKQCIPHLQIFLPFFFCTHWKSVWQIHFKFLINFTLHINSAVFFNWNFLEIWPTERALDSLKADVTKKIISQELKQILSSCKKQWKAYLMLIFNTDSTILILIFHTDRTITLLLASHIQSFSIYRQSSPFRGVFIKVLLKCQLYVVPKHNNLYIHGIRV